MKYLHYIFRNIRRNRLRSFLTIASTGITILLMVILVSYASLNGEIASSMRVYNRLMTMSSQGFAGRIPYSRVNEIAAMDGVSDTSPFVWYGGKYGEEVIPFAQFAVDPEKIFSIYEEYSVDPEQPNRQKGDNIRHHSCKLIPSQTFSYHCGSLGPGRHSSFACAVRTNGTMRICGGLVDTSCPGVGCIPASCSASAPEWVTGHRAPAGRAPPAGRDRPPGARARARTRSEARAARDRSSPPRPPTPA